MSTKIDYTALDAAIIASINEGKTTAGRLLDDHHKTIARMDLRDPFGRPLAESNVLGRRLQALRRSGKIVCYGTRYWSIK